MPKISDIKYSCPEKECDNYDDCFYIDCARKHFDKYKPVTEKTLQIRKLKQQIQDHEVLKFVEK